MSSAPKRPSYPPGGGTGDTGKPCPTFLINKNHSRELKLLLLVFCLPLGGTNTMILSYLLIFLSILFYLNSYPAKLSTNLSPCTIISSNSHKRLATLKLTYKENVSNCD